MTRSNRFKGLWCGLAAIGFAYAGIAHAESVTNVTVTGVGNQGTQLYATLATTPPGCRGAVIYHSSEIQAGQYVMSILLSARLANRPLTRIDYSVHGDGTCWIVLVEV
ncbi:hypothetical protein BW41_00652 [Sphingomonas sp. RIT328]|nr:hypothetical protein BW41_00652 [Sphingomonas sp. RIT328]